MVLDDIWNVEDWNNLRGGFLGNDGNSKILLTSRNKQVPLHIDPGSLLYELRCLDDEKSWELFEKIAWREGTNTIKSIFFFYEFVFIVVATPSGVQVF